MSRRGRIVLECDVPKCHAEIVLDAFDCAICAIPIGISMAAFAREWQMHDGKMTCPQCAAEGKRA